MTSSSAPSTAFDMTAIGRKDLRDRLRHALEEMEGTGSVDESEDFWTSFVASRKRHGRRPTLVLGNLASVVQEFRKHRVHDWTTYVRNSHCYFVTFVRTEQDKSYAAWVDDLVKASDLRVNVCNDVTDWSIVTKCLRSAVAALQPQALIDVRFLPDQRQFRVQFGDGRTGTFGLDEIGLSEREDLIPESATVGEFGTTVELATVSGGLFEIDGAALRALVDEDLRRQIAEQGKNQTIALGGLLREKRKQAGLTQAELGERAGLDQAVISRIERGRVRPRIDTLRQFANALDLSVGQLLSP